VSKKAVVVGGSGFLGSHVADCLSDNGFRVTIFDYCDSRWLRDDQEIVIGDILDVDVLERTIKGAKIVYNFAALADLNQALNNPIETVKINILGNLNVLEACRVHKVERFIYASTVYVQSREGGFYKCSKKSSESYVEEYQKLYGLNYTILRYGSVYGPRADETNGIYRIISSALRTGVVRYQGNAESIREYIHVDDASRASVAILEDSFKNETIILTGQESLRVIDLVKMVVEILNLPHDSVEFIDGEYAGHYVRTPYAYEQKTARRYIPSKHIDLGQGLLQTMSDIDNV
jgi:UDP-glucose 4-epimerase